MQRQKVLMDAVHPTVETEGFVEFVVTTIRNRSDFMQLKLQHNDVIFYLNCNCGQDDCVTIGNVPRIDAGEYVVLHHWREEIVAIQVIGTGSTVKCLFLFQRPLPAPEVRFGDKD